MTIVKKLRLSSLVVFILLTCAACASKPTSKVWTIEEGAAALERYVKEYPEKSLAELRGFSDAQLCQRYESPYVVASPILEKLVEEVLQERNVTQCHTRVVPQEVAPTPTSNDSWAASFVVRWGDQSDFMRGFAELSAAPRERDPFETEAEFAVRKVAYATELASRSEASRMGYRITLPINNPNNNKGGRSYFDPELGQVCVPMFESLQGVGKSIDGQNEFDSVNHYYVELESVGNPATRSGRIFVVSATTSGLAILRDAKPNMSRRVLPMLSVSVTEEVARDLLSGGKIVFEVVPDYRDPRGQSGSFVPYLVAADSETSHFSVEYRMAIGVFKKNHGLPVRLLSVSLRDSNDSEVARADGWQIGTALVARASEGCEGVFK